MRDYGWSLITKFKVVQKARKILTMHGKRKAEDYYWEADNLQEEKQVGEFTLCVDEDDDDTDDEEGSATDGTMSDDSSDDEL